MRVMHSRAQSTPSDRDPRPQLPPMTWVFWYLHGELANSDGQLNLRAEKFLAQRGRATHMVVTSVYGKTLNGIHLTVTVFEPAIASQLVLVKNNDNFEHWLVRNVLVWWQFHDTNGTMTLRSCGSRVMHERVCCTCLQHASVMCCTSRVRCAYRERRASESGRRPKIKSVPGSRPT